MRTRSPRRWFWIAVLMIGCALAGIQSRPRTVGPASPPVDVAATVSRPAQSVLARLCTGTRRLFGGLGGLWEAEQTNERLRVEVERLRATDEELAECRQELARLRALVGLQDAVKRPVVAARSIGRGPSPWFHTLDVDVGRKQGVGPGCAVVAPAGLVGQLYRVGYNTSKVLCLTDRQASVGARLQPERVRHVVGVCRGDGESALVFEYPDANADVRPGDAVVTSGWEHGSRFPPGLLIGHVLTVEPRPHESLLVAVVRPAVELGRVEEVLIIRSEETEEDGQ